MSISLPSLG